MCRGLDGTPLLDVRCPRYLGCRNSPPKSLASTPPLGWSVALTGRFPSTPFWTSRPREQIFRESRTRYVTPPLRSGLRGPANGYQGGVLHDVRTYIHQSYSSKWEYSPETDRTGEHKKIQSSSSTGSLRCTLSRRRCRAYRNCAVYRTSPWPNFKARLLHSKTSVSAEKGGVVKIRSEIC